MMITTRDEDGSQLTEKELVDTLMLIINAGHETTVNVRGGCNEPGHRRRRYPIIGEADGSWVQGLDRYLGR